jgi:predicted dipeptidase
MNFLRSELRLVIFFILAVCISPNSLATMSGISKQQTADIVTDYSNNYSDNFTGFLNALRQDSRYPQLQDSITSYLANKALDEKSNSKIFRLVGIYSRLKYGEDALATLTRLVEIPTGIVDGQAQHDNPQIKKIGETIVEISRAFGLVYRNVDNRVFEVTLPGSRDVSKQGTYLIGLHAHADVVPANKDNWDLEDGTRLDPFKVTIIGNRMYGRGTQDDKNGIVVALYAMKLIKEENIPLKQTFKLLVDTTEETTSEAIPYYMERNVIPAYNLAIDGSYPVVIAEKGYAVIMAKFPVRKGSGQGAELISITGGLATNQIPVKSVAVINVDDTSAFKTHLDPLGKAYVAANGNNFSIDSSVVEGNSRQLRLTVTGVSAHSSRPSSGVNPVARMLGFIARANSKLDFKQNHITDAAQYVADNWGLGFYGKTLGINFSHDFMGPLTAALTQVKLDETKLQVAVNLRIPKGRPLADLENTAKTGINKWMKLTNINFDVDYIFKSEPMYRNPEGIWVNTLLDVASESLDIERKFASSAGGTSAKTLPNGVQFGLALSTEKYTGHNANEFKTMDQFFLDLQIVTEMIMAIGHLQELN